MAQVLNSNEGSSRRCGRKGAQGQREGECLVSGCKLPCPWPLHRLPTPGGGVGTPRVPCGARRIHGKLDVQMPNNKQIFKRPGCASRARHSARRRHCLPTRGCVRQGLHGDQAEIASLTILEDVRVAYRLFIRSFYGCVVQTRLPCSTHSVAGPPGDRALPTTCPSLPAFGWPSALPWRAATFAWYTRACGSPRPSAGPLCGSTPGEVHGAIGGVRGPARVGRPV